MRYLILGGNYTEAMTWAESRGLDPHCREVVIMTGPRRAAGMHVGEQDELVLTGTWWRNPDLRTILITLHRNLHARRDGGKHSMAKIIDPLVDEWRAQEGESRVVRERLIDPDKRAASRMREEVAEARGAALEIEADNEFRRARALMNRKGGMI